MTHPATHFTQHYAINTTLVNFNQRLGLVGLLNILQDTATLHAESLGHGYQTSLEQGCFWVLSQQQLRMKHWPVWHDTLTVETWIRNIRGISAIRDYALLLGNKRIGECSTLWLLLDKDTHRPKRLKQLADGFLTDEAAALSFAPEKIITPDDLTPWATHAVTISDLDINQHVSNTKYAEWLLDSLPIELHRQFTIASYAVNFLAETFLGDCVSCESNLAKQATDSLQSALYCRGIRKPDDNMVFTARIIPQTLA